MKNPPMEYYTMRVIVWPFPSSPQEVSFSITIQTVAGLDEEYIKGVVAQLINPSLEFVIEPVMVE